MVYLLRLVCVIIVFCIRSRAIRVIGQDETVTEGADTQLHCELVETKERLTSITWQRRTEERPKNTEFFAVTVDGKVAIQDVLRNRVKFTGNFLGLDGSILLSNVTVSDEGIYTCVLSAFPSGPQKAEINLRVQVPPVASVSTEEPPVAGDRGILATCTAANAVPAAEVSWRLGILKDSVLVQTNTTVDSEGRATVKSSLIGLASKELNQESVQCLIRHPGLKEELELDYTLIIHYPPQVVYITSAGDDGETCEFQCEADANPKPTNFTWSRNSPVKELLSRGVNSRQRFQLTSDSNGLYFCVASNQCGNAVGSIYMHVTPRSVSICWTLFIIALFVVGFGLFIWKFQQPIRKKLGFFSHDPVTAVDSD